LPWRASSAPCCGTVAALRIVLPFAIFWTLLFPVMAAITISLERGASRVIPVFRSGALLSRLHPLHLWFLEYLILLYALGALAAWLAPGLPKAAKYSVHRAFRWALQRAYAPAIFALFSWLPLTLMHGNLKDPDGFPPEWRILIGYVPPFAFGWLLYHSRDLLARFEKHIWIYLALAVPAFFVYGLVSGRDYPLLKAAGNVLLCWFLIFVTIGLFLRYCSRPSPRWRYMSDSSYWLYVMHMPVVVGLQVAFANVPLPAIAKVPIVLAISVFILVATYDLFVRPTAIGALLNGRRYQRRLQEFREEAVAAAV